MTRTEAMHQLVRKAKGRMLEVKGRATGDRRSQLRGRALRAQGGARLTAHRFGRKLRHVGHR
jgi:uncharacterized protein YjbJ (UPF0337 family)